MTDCPTLLASIYLNESDKHFKINCLNTFKSHQNFNLFINRGKEFQQTGRIHDLSESKAIDRKIKQFLNDNDIYYGTYYHKTVDVLVDNIMKNIERINATKEMSLNKQRAENDEPDICDD